MISIPSRAGIAQLHLNDRTRRPRRKRNEIILPAKTTREFHSLHSGNQFIAGCSSDSDNGTSYYFGGTDEGPFLVQVGRRYGSLVAQEGENSFYESLKPDEVKQYEDDEGRPALRQGDIFAYPATEWQDLNPSDPSVRRALKLILNVDLDLEQVDGGDHMFSSARVLETRHILHGFAWPTWDYGRSRNRQMPFYAKGVLKAPDHKDLMLREVHFLTRAVGMVANPWEID